MSTGIIDLSAVPAPGVVEALDFKTILDAMYADLVARDPTFAALTASDPAYKILEVCAFREMLVRARVNDAAKSVMLAYAGGTDLDNLAVFYGVTRKPGETDPEVRRRCQLALHALNTAGSEGSYLYHALSVVYRPTDPEADPEVVADASVDSPVPGTVRIAVLGTTDAPNNGAVSENLRLAVVAALDGKTVRPLTDTVEVVAGEITTYAITATLYFFNGPDKAVVMANADAAVRKYAAENFRLGRDITISGIYAALHQSGVSRVVLSSPSVDVAIAGTQAARCTAFTLTDGGLST